MHVLEIGRSRRFLGRRESKKETDHCFWLQLIYLRWALQETEESKKDSSQKLTRQRLFDAMGAQSRVPKRITYKDGYSPEAGPRVAAIVSIVESCRRLNIPIRVYLGSVLPGLANRPISQTAELTPAAWANRNASAMPPTSAAV
jgi:hypothetical protein